MYGKYVGREVFAAHMSIMGRLAACFLFLSSKHWQCVVRVRVGLIYRIFLSERWQPVFFAVRMDRHSKGRFKSSCRDQAKTYNCLHVEMACHACTKLSQKMLMMGTTPVWNKDAFHIIIRRRRKNHYMVRNYEDEVQENPVRNWSGKFVSIVLSFRVKKCCFTLFHPHYSETRWGHSFFLSFFLQKKSNLKNIFSILGIILKRSDLTTSNR